MDRKTKFGCVYAFGSGTTMKVSCLDILIALISTLIAVGIRDNFACETSPVDFRSTFGSWRMILAACFTQKITEDLIVCVRSPATFVS